MKVSNKLMMASLILALSTACGQKDRGDDESDSESTEQQSGTVNGVVGGTGTTQEAPNSAVSLNVQGKFPAQLALQATPLEVTGPDGNAMGTFHVTDARLVLEQIRLKKMNGTDDDSATAQSESSTAQAEAPAEEAAVDDSTSVDASAEGVEDPTSPENQKFKGPYVVDLLTNIMTPTPEDIVIPDGLYRRVELRVHKTEENELGELGLAVDDPLNGNSIYVAGDYTRLDGTVVPFKMTFDLSEDFESRSEAGFQISSQGVNDFMIAFQLAEWFRFDNPETNKSGLSMDDITDLEIILDKESKDAAKELRELIKDNIKLSADVGKDDDGDGSMESEEETASAEVQ